MYRVWYWATIDRENDGRFVASIPDLWDLAAYGDTDKDAIAHVTELASERVRAAPPPSASNNQVILMHQRPHRLDQLNRFIGLGEEKPAFGHILLANSNVARCKHKLDRWPAVPDSVCKP
jgi:predicted RNase H-like HicB family nuclease